MKKVIAGLTIVLIAIAASAALNSTFTAVPPVQYEDNTAIPSTDILTYRIYCSPAQGGPYNVSWDVGTDPTNMVVDGVDMTGCVQGTPGTYYFVATATSTDYNSESQFSNETMKLFTAGDVGKTPMAPTLFSVQ